MAVLLLFVFNNIISFGGSKLAAVYEKCFGSQLVKEPPTHLPVTPYTRSLLTTSAVNIWLSFVLPTIKMLLPPW